MALAMHTQTVLSGRLQCVQGMLASARMLCQQ
jgi:hypothetical protein